MPVTTLLPEPTPQAPATLPTTPILVAICAAATALYALYWNGVGPDDPWITFRYAENIAAGRGFVFNVGERVYGTSTPLFALLLAAARLAGLSVPVTSWIIGLLAMNASIILLFRLVRFVDGDVSGIAAAGLLASSYLVHRVATFGMETPLYLLLIIGAFYAYVTGRIKTASVLAALCLLMRLDGLAVAAALGLTHVIVRREVPWRAILIYILVVSPWLLFATLYFGAPFPNTMVAKQLHTLHTRLYWMPAWLIREPRAWLALIGAGYLLYNERTRAWGLPLAIWAILYVAAYTYTPMHLYVWYKTPLMAVLAGFAGVAVVRLAAVLAETAPRRLAAAAAISTAALLPDAAHAGWRMLGNEGILVIEHTRYEAARWMDENLPADARIATGGIGLVGYYTGRHLYDGMGLITPGSMRYYETPPNPRAVPYPRFLEAVIADYDPQYIFDGFHLADRDMPPFMEGKYEVLKRWPKDPPYGWQFILYERADGR